MRILKDLQSNKKWPVNRFSGTNNETVILKYLVKVLLDKTTIWPRGRKTFRNYLRMVGRNHLSLQENKICSFIYTLKHFVIICECPCFKGVTLKYLLVPKKTYNACPQRPVRSKTEARKKSSEKKEGFCLAFFAIFHSTCLKGLSHPLLCKLCQALREKSLRSNSSVS